MTHFGRWAKGANPDDHQWNKFALRTARYRLVNNNALFDMLTDPGQQHNIIEDHPELVAQLREQYDAWWQVTRTMLVNEDAEFLSYRPFHRLYEHQLNTKGIPDWLPPEL